ncbi:hypothetical protein BOX15_Mlig015266g1, partial [Macrostomum lignano]
IEFSSMSVAVDATSNISLESGFSPLHLFECTLANAGMLVDSMPPTDLVLALRFLSTLHGRIVDVMEPSVGDACRLANAYKTCFDPNEPAKEPAATSQQVSDSTVDKKSNYLSTTVAVKTESKSSLKAATMLSDCQFAQQDSNMDYASEYSDDCLIVDELNEATTSIAAAEDSSASEARTRAEAALKDSYQSIKGSSLHPFDFSKPFEHETNQSVAERVLRVTASRTAGTLGLSKDDLMSILRSSIFNVFGPYRLKNKKSYTRTRWKQQKLARRQKAFEEIISSLQPEEMEQYGVVLTREFTTSDEEEEESGSNGAGDSGSSSCRRPRLRARRHYWESDRVRDIKRRLDDLFLRRFATKRQRDELTSRRQTVDDAVQTLSSTTRSQRMPPAGAPDWALNPQFRSRGKE